MTAISKKALLLGLIFLIPATSMKAEQILIQSPAGKEGQGWLFGAYTGGRASCWIAAPNHVITDAAGKPLPFNFLDRLNRQGESDTPIPVQMVPKALEATNNNDDLAFAHVLSGRSNDCLSRLGPESYTYNVLLSQQPVVSVLSMTRTSHVRFNAQITQTGIRAEGTLFDLKPVDADKTAKYLGQGVSGATAELIRQEGPMPVAMILGKGREPGTRRALRFDRIKQAFQHVSAFYEKQRRQDRANQAGIPYTIQSIDLISLSKGISSTSLSKGDQCWRVTPRGGKQQVQISIALSDPKDRINSLSVIRNPDCGKQQALQVGVDVRRSDKESWYRHASCKVGQSEAESACRIGLTGPRQLRLSIITKTPIGLSELVLR